MLPTPFLTAWDPRQTLKGSRDPLGAMALWTAFGRQLVGNLTTVSTSVRDFTVTMLGYHLVDRARALQGPGFDIPVFLKWEQLAAYVRVHALGERSGFRGVERTKLRLQERGTRTVLGTRSEHQILGDQRTYGLMGTYTMPSRSSGLLEGEPIRLSREAAGFVERTYLRPLEQRLGRTMDQLAARLCAEEVPFALEGKDAPWVEALADVLKRRILAKERPFYQEHVLYNTAGAEDPTQGRQHLLALHLTEVPVQEWNTTVLHQRAHALEKQGATGQSVAEKLLDIAAADAVLAPVSVLFGFLQARHGQKLATVIGEVREQWGKGLRHVDTAAFKAVLPRIHTVDADNADAWMRMAECLRQGQWDELTGLVLAQNGTIMQRRGAAAWITVKDGLLDVRFVDETSALLRPEHLQEQVRFNYFLPSLQGIADQLRP